MTRNRRRFRPPEFLEEEAEEDDEEPAPGLRGPPERLEEEAEDEEEDGTSVDDLTQPADPQQFDQTFTDDDTPLSIAGNFDPTAGPKQAIPRLAFVLNYNLVYNEARERWEPQKKSSSSVGGGARLFQTAVVNQNVQPFGSETITLDGTTFEDPNVAQKDGNTIEIQTDGRYLLIAQVTLDGAGDEERYRLSLRVNGNLVSRLDKGVSSLSPTRSASFHTSTHQDLSAGDAVTMRLFNSQGFSRQVLGQPYATYLEVVQVKEE